MMAVPPHEIAQLITQLFYADLLLVHGPDGIPQFSHR